MIDLGQIQNDFLYQPGESISWVIYTLPSYLFHYSSNTFAFIWFDSSSPSSIVVVHSIGLAFYSMAPASTWVGWSQQFRVTGAMEVAYRRRSTIWWQPAATPSKDLGHLLIPIKKNLVGPTSCALLSFIILFRVLGMPCAAPRKNRNNNLLAPCPLRGTDPWRWWQVHCQALSPSSVNFSLRVQSGKGGEGGDQVSPIWAREHEGCPWEGL